MEISNPKRKKKNQSIEGQFMHKLATCSKNNDLSAALSLYDEAVSQNLRLNHNHYDNLLYLCCNSLSHSPETLDSSKIGAIEKGFCIYNSMLANNINPTEATITTVARLAAAKGDGDCAFELVKSMGKYKILPRLRTYDPALFTFCKKSEAEKAYSVEEHMASVGVHLEEPELAVLMKVSAEAGLVDKVYSYLHSLRNCVTNVKASTAEIIQAWFSSKLASQVGCVDWNKTQIKDVMLKNGGGWHGQGWLGKGNWTICKSNINSDAACCSCGEHLACVDIDQKETEMFAESVASLATQREVTSDFRAFQEWLDNHGNYDAVVDGANVGLYQQNFADGGFSITQLESVVKDLYERSGKKWPLIILHNKRVRSLMNSHNHKLVESWQKQGVLYTTPNGSNDDWYWLYASVKLKCLLVTNDEMRDHIFELLGSSFFLKWKERHRVQFTFLKSNLKLLMPPSYSVVTQESENGSWHVPIEGECNGELSRTWLCITRPMLGKTDETVENFHAPVNGEHHGEHHVPTSFPSFNNGSMSDTAGMEHQPSRIGYTDLLNEADSNVVVNPSDTYPQASETPPTTPRTTISKKTSSRGTSFSSQEDMLIISAWLNVSQDATVENDQRQGSYWERIFEYYNTHKNFGSNRTKSAIRNRWGVISTAVSKFCGCVSEIESLHQNGVTENDKINSAKAVYADNNKAQFNLDHCWNVLRCEQKWVHYVELHKKRVKKASTLDVVNVEDNVLEASFVDMDERHPGKKAEKTRSHERNDLSEDDSEIKTMLLGFQKNKKKMHDDRMEIQRKQSLQNDKRLAQDAERIAQENLRNELRGVELALEKRREDERILTMDTTGMSSHIAVWYQLQQKKILETNGLL